MLTRENVALTYRVLYAVMILDLIFVKYTSVRLSMGRVRELILD